MLTLSRIYSILLTPVLAIAPVWAESNSPSAPGSSESSESTLEIHLVQNQDTAPVNTTSLKSLTVEVTDGRGTPVEGAAVAFRLPDSEPTGTFSDGTHAAVSYSDAAGRASLANIHWGATAGAVEIRLTAAKGALHAGLLVSTNLSVTGEKLAATTPATPGTLVSPAKASDAVSAATTGISAPTPGTIDIAKVQTGAPTPAPEVSITNGAGVSTGAGTHVNTKKWVLIASIGAGLGIGAAMA